LFYEKKTSDLILTQLRQMLVSYFMDYPVINFRSEINWPEEKTT